MKTRILSFLIQMALIPIAHGQCPDWILNSVPACPNGNSSILPETYPALGIVVSDKNSSKYSQSFNVDFISAVIKASKGRTPLIFMTSQNDTFQQVRNKLRGLPRARSVIVHAPGAYPDHAWVQDPFLSTFNLENGNPMIREISGYQKKFKTTSQKPLVTKMKETCELFSEGASLPPHSLPQYAFDLPYSGGNIIGLPGSLCLHGDKQSWNSFASYYCGSKENEVVISSSWLAVGHVDEIFAVIPYPYPTDKECSFAFAFASPKKGLELLNQYKEEPFISFFKKTSAEEKKQRFLNLDGPLSLLCRQIKKHKRDPKFNCENISNQDVAQLIEENQEFKLENEMIQAEINRSKQIIFSSVSKRITTCRPKIIDVPGLFYKKENFTGNTSLSTLAKGTLPKGAFKSYLPNVANLMVIENTVIGPHPQNLAFQRYMEEQYRTLGIDYIPIDSYFLHELEGNIHCATHKIPICRK